MNSNKKTMRLLPESERPYEKCEKYGVKTLSDAELLAVVIRSGSRQESAVELAVRLLEIDSSRPGLEGLMNVTGHQLQKLHGIGRAKAVQILAVCELSRRIAKSSNRLPEVLSSPEAIADYYKEELRHLKVEQLRLMMLDTKSRLIKEEILSVGTVNASLVDPREVFIHAVREEAVNIILIHNHPSGDASPSKEDILVTQRICSAGTLLGIHLLDHIIIGNHQFTSLHQAGYV